MATVSRRPKASDATQASKAAGARTKGMVVPRVFSKPGVSPYDQVEWDLRTAAIKDELKREIERVVEGKGAAAEAKRGKRVGG